MKIPHSFLILLKSCPLLHLLLVLVASCPPLDAMPDLEPGVYRVHNYNLRTADNWRVTDPKAPHSGAQAFLPNPAFIIPDVEPAGAERAFLTMHHWAGHSDTLGQQVLINGEHRLDVPLNPNLDLWQPERYLNSDNPLLEIPLEWLQEGDNTFEGTLDPAHQGSHWWGQWGWYFLRLFLELPDPVEGSPDGVLNVEAPGKHLTGNSVTLHFEPAEGSNVTQVTFYARYYGFDVDGDSISYEWQGFEESRFATQGHVGTDSAPPFSVEWDTSWIPDQQPGAIAFTAVASNGSHIRVLEPLEGYSLDRDFSVKLFTAKSYPFSLVRNGTNFISYVPIPEPYPIGQASDARFLIRTWNGVNNEQGHTPLRINDSEYMEDLIVGQNHYYGMDFKAFPVGLLKNGDNRLQAASTTTHHGCEILVPGPAFLVRWESPLPDYLDTGEAPGVPGWYAGNLGPAYFHPFFAPWFFTGHFGWVHAYRPYQPAGWYFHPEMGDFWSASTLFPWVFHAGRADWIYFLGTTAEGYRFYSYSEAEEIVLGGS